MAIRLRRDTAANWTALNPILAAGEPADELDTPKFKIGDGVTPWNSLPYTGGTSSIEAGNITDATDLGKAILTAESPADILELLGLTAPDRKTEILSVVREDGYRRVFKQVDPDAVPADGESGDLVAVVDSVDDFEFIPLAAAQNGTSGTTISSGTLADDGGDDDVFAVVWSANTSTTAGTTTSPVGSTNPAWNADSLSGSGRTWTKVVNTESSLTNGQGGIGLWRGVPTTPGSATTGAVTATWSSTAHGSAGTAAKDVRGIQVVQVADIAGGVEQAATTGPITVTNPTGALTGVDSGHPCLCAIMFNGESQAADLAAGSAWTEDSANTQLASGAASLQVSLAYILAGQNTCVWGTGASTNWKSVLIAELLP